MRLFVNEYAAPTQLKRTKRNDGSLVVFLPHSSGKCGHDWLALEFDKYPGACVYPGEDHLWSVYVRVGRHHAYIRRRLRLAGVFSTEVPWPRRRYRARTTAGLW